MFEEMEPKKNVTKMQLTVTLILILFFSITSATYAYFAISATNNNTITGSAATVNLTLSVNKIFPTSSSTNTGVMVPQLSVSGSSTSPLANALKGGCVDNNANVVCQVYKITIQNVGGTATQVVDGKVFFYGNSVMTTDVHTTMPNLKWKLITSVDTTTPTNSVLGTNEDQEANSSDNKFVSSLTLATNDTFDYYMIVWINETNTNQTSEPGKTFYGKIQFDSSNGTGVTSTFTP